MTERKWLVCSDPNPMLESLRGKTTERKLRLFALACCRQIWDSLNETCRSAVVVAERQADGLAPGEELRVAFDAVHWFVYGVFNNPGGDAVLNAVGLGVWFDFPKETISCTAVAATYAAHVAAGTLPRDLGRWIRGVRAARGRFSAAQASQAALLREVIGNPFRPITQNASWRTRTVAGLAETIYQEGAFERLPILGDALEDAGCSSEAILNHLRQPGGHVRGCWTLDLVLGRE
jgi:hypothetical protein